MTKNKETIFDPSARGPLVLSKWLCTVIGHAIGKVSCRMRVYSRYRWL